MTHSTAPLSSDSQTGPSSEPSNAAGEPTPVRKAPATTLTVPWVPPYRVEKKRTSDTGARTVEGQAVGTPQAAARYSAEFLQHLSAPRHRLEGDSPAFRWNGMARQDVGEGSLTLWIQLDPDGELCHLTWRADRLPSVVALTSAFSVALLSGGERNRPMTVADALKLDAHALLTRLGGGARLEQAIAPELFRQAVQDYFRRQGIRQQSESTQSHREALCHCWGVGADEVEALALSGADFETAREQLGVSTGCGSCYGDVRAYFELSGARARACESAREAVEGLYSEDV